MRNRLKEGLVLAFLLGGGGFMTLSGWSPIRVDQKLTRSGMVAEGRVIEHATGQYSRRSSHYSLTVTFVPTNRPPVTKSFTVDGGTYRAAVQSGTVPVRYLPDNPDVGMAGYPEMVPYWILALFGSAVFLTGVILVGYRTVRGPGYRT